MIGGEPTTAGMNGEPSPELNAIAVISKVTGKPMPSRRKPAMVSSLASARRAAGLGRSAAMAAFVRKSRHSRTRVERKVYVARAPQAQLIVLQEKRGFYHLTLRRRNYNYI